MERFVRKATAEDLPVALDLIESGRRIMRENGNPHQWGDSHPTVETNNIRIDTHWDNKPMQGALAKAGFHYCGIIHLLDGDERLAYQKIIDSH